MDHYVRKEQDKETLDYVQKRLRPENLEIPHHLLPDEIKKIIQKGDKLISWEQVDGPLCGHGGIALVRNDKVVFQMQEWIS